MGGRFISVRTWAILGILAVLAGGVQARVFELYYLGGQSNMDGYGYVKDVPAELASAVDDVWVFHGNTSPDMAAVDGRGLWSRLRVGHGVGFASDGKRNSYSDRFGVELTFARRIKELRPQANIAIIKYSRGGTSIDAGAARDFGCWQPDFDKGNGVNQYDHFLAAVRNALSVSDIDGDGEDDRLVPRGIVWMQGESDAAATREIAGRYRENLTELMGLVRKALGGRDVAISIGRISDSGSDDDGKVWDFGGIVRKAQADFVAADACAALVTSTDSYAYSDKWHYDSKGYIDLGAKFAESLVSAMQKKGGGRLKVFILAGQSNMQGQGFIASNPNRNEGKGTLEYIVKQQPQLYGHLVDGAGNWVVRDDVWIWYMDRKGGLTVGYGARDDRIGPELGFGNVVGDAMDDQVLLIKVAWGGKSLAKDFRPPSSGGEVGEYYKLLLKHVRDVLADIKGQFPEYDGRGYELVGFGWHQGWNDRVNQASNDEYESNMVNFIVDIRKDLGVEKLPFVIAETGMSGHEEKHPRALSLMKAQAAAAEHEQFKGNVAFVGTKDFFRPKEQSPSGQAYHWNTNAETYYLIGQAMGEAMLKLCETK